MKNFKNLTVLCNVVDQGFPTWGTRHPRGTRGAVNEDASFSGVSSLW